MRPSVIAALGLAAVVAVVLVPAVFALPISSLGGDSAAAGSTMSYAGQKVVRVDLSAVDETRRAAFRALTDKLGLDIWSEGDVAVDVRVTPQQALILQENGFSFSVYIEDVQALIDGEFSASSVNSDSANTTNAWFQTYHRYDAIVQYYKDLAATYPNLVTFVPSIGKSFEGRDIAAVRVKGRASGAKKIYWQGGIHARERISPAALAYQYTKLVQGYGSDSSATSILDTFEVVIIPVVNPDGYEFTWTGDRLWRKNRRKNTGSNCIGVDLNRNWDSAWASTGSSNLPCSDVYHGTKAFSEPETTASSNYFLAVGNVKFAVDFHAYGQYVLRPYGYTNRLTPIESTLKALGDGVAAKIKEVNGLTYTSQRSVELYPAAGATEDWMYEVSKGDTWGYCFELRDEGRYGFVLPENQIIPQGEELWNGLKYAASYVATNHP